MALSKEEINKYYKQYLGRDLVEGEYERHWTDSKLKAKDVQNVIMRSPEAQTYNEYMDRYSQVNKEFPGGRAEVESALSGYYEKYLGRTDDAGVKAWADDIMAGKYDIATLEKNFRRAASDEKFQRIINRTEEPVDFGLDEAAVQRGYEKASIDVREGITAKAAGGGLDTGGYLTSLAKGQAELETGRINTLADLNSRVAQFRLNRDTQIANLMLAKENQEIGQEQFETEMAAYNAEIEAVREAVKKGQENWWQVPAAQIVGTVVGGLVAGPYGAVAGGQLAGAWAQAEQGTQAVPSMTRAAPAPTSMLSRQYIPGGQYTGQYAGAYGLNTANKNTGGGYNPYGG